MFEMQEEIREAIEKNLPQAVGEVLRKQLDRLDKLETLHKTDTERITALSESIDGNEKRIKKLIAELELSGDLDDREKAVAKREVAQGLFRAEVKLEAVEHAHNKIIVFIDALMRNTVHREAVLRTTGTDFSSSGDPHTYETGHDKTQEDE